MIKRTISLITTLTLAIGALILPGCCNKQATLKDASKAYKSGDYKTAAEIFIPEARKGNPEALVNLAFMYYCGLHVERNYLKASDYYLEAAKKNNVTAQFSLGTMYENGEGVTKSLSEAYFWYLLAEKQNDSDARKLRREAEQVLDASTVKEIRRRVEQWNPVK
ncbi:MAG: tetratricopeptide repeat protein [Candidatus Riflebacteria bacterium]|nr:tetratricopeptide repeat protein [Candidatus Riflebacteria bacterium]